MTVPIPMGMEFDSVGVRYKGNSSYRWGAAIQMEGSVLEYYIYAENAEAGIFSPARAEYEYHSLSTYGDVVINEFMASNDLTASDQDGEFNDWIELHNNTREEISLDGYYLSDKSEEPFKWVFPDTSIAAEGYLIVWADKDTLQAGLHSNFKLSASGESILLSDASGALLDQVTYYLQASDISTGRNPNGTGAFMEMLPTFSAENSSIIASQVVHAEIPEFKIYPNPATDQLNIQMEGDQDHQVSLFNLYGQLIHQWQSGSLLSIDISHLSSGVYILSVDNLATAKFIKR